jgi:hypothetical protein
MLVYKNMEASININFKYEILEVFLAYKKQAAYFYLSITLNFRITFNVGPPMKM